MNHATHSNSIEHPLSDELGEATAQSEAPIVPAGEVQQAPITAPMAPPQYKAIVEDQTEVVSRFTSDGVFLFVNEVYCRTFGRTFEEIVGSRWHPVAYPDDIPNIEAKLGTLSPANPVVRIENRVFTADGSICWMEFVNRGFFDSDGNLSDGNLVEIQSVGRDITERRKAEEQLRASEDRMRLATEAARIGTWDWNLRTGEVLWSDNLEEYLGLDPGSFGGTIEEFKALVYPDDLPMVEARLGEALTSGAPYQAEFRMRRTDGSIRWTTTKGRAFFDEEGNAIRMVGVDVDISDRKRIEDELRASLREREVLLRELHHRVKNNLQVISGLLYLQSGYSRDEATVALFRESEQRVVSMALVHELLYRSKDLGKVDFKGYLEVLSENLVRAYQRDTAVIELDARCEEVAMPLEAAMPCGLLVNELLSNCLKHAFTGKTSGHIVIELRAIEGDQVLLRVCDDGVGLPDSVQPETAESFGFQLISSLSQQLHGRLEFLRQGGTEVRLTFPLEA